MNHLEDPLRGYQLSGPPPDLRARIVREATGPRRVGLRDWIPALAAAALIVLLQVLASEITNNVYDQIAGPIVSQQVEVPLQ
jgi:hypothetical protein